MRLHWKIFRGGGSYSENGVTAQEDTAAIQIPLEGTTITEGGNYEIPEGTYTGPIVINVTDTTKPVNIAIKGKVTVKKDPFFSIKKAGIVNINNEDNYEVDCATYARHLMFMSYSAAQVTVTNGQYKGSGGTHLIMNFSGSLTLNNITAQTESSYAITSAGTVIINGGTYTRNGRISTSTENGAIGNGGGTMELHNVTVNSCQVAVTNSNGELTIDGGNYTSDNGFNCIRNESAGLKICSGVFEGKGASCIQNTWGRVEINDGSFTSDADCTIKNRGGLRMNGGTVATSNAEGTVIDCNGDFGDTQINGGTIKGGKDGIRLVNLGSSGVTLKNAAFENNTQSNIHLGDGQTINIKKTFTGTAKILTDDAVVGRRITLENEDLSYQNKLNLISVDPEYIIGYKRGEDGVEYRYLASANGKIVTAENAKATADLGAGEQELDTATVVPKGTQVTVTADIPAKAEFLDWSVSRADGEALDWTPAEDDPQTITFTMPGCNVTVTALYQGGNGDIDNPSGGSSDVVTGIAAVALTGAAAWGIYEAGTGIYRVLNMPGVPMPSNRAGLATLIWEKAGCPEPETVKSFCDIDEADLHLRKAASWMEEQALMSDEAENEFRPYHYVTKLRTCLVWDKAKEKGLIS